MGTTTCSAYSRGGYVNIYTLCQLHAVVVVVGVGVGVVAVVMKPSPLLKTPQIPIRTKKEKKRSSQLGHSY